MLLFKVDIEMDEFIDYRDCFREIVNRAKNILPIMEKELKRLFAKHLKLCVPQ